MTRNATMWTWVIVVVVIIIIIGVWWYYGTKPNDNTASLYNNTDTTTTQTPTKSSEKSINSFVFESLPTPVNAVVNNTTYTIAATVPKNTDVKNLTPTITTSAKAIVSPVSGATKDFTSPVIYTVTAEDGSTQNYTVTVTKAAQ